MKRQQIDLPKARTLISHAALSAGVIQQAARGERDDLRPDAIARHARAINDLLKELSAIIDPPSAHEPQYYIPGHYAGD
jgi:hypothetical protein